MFSILYISFKEIMNICTKFLFQNRKNLINRQVQVASMIYENNMNKTEENEQTKKLMFEFTSLPSQIEYTEKAISNVCEYNKLKKPIEYSRFLI